MGCAKVYLDDFTCAAKKNNTQAVCFTLPCFCLSNVQVVLKAPVTVTNSRSTENVTTT